MTIKYTKDTLVQAVSTSTSFHDVLRKFGLSITCGHNSTRMKQLISKYDIDISHFLGLRSNHGINHKGGSEKLDWSKILVLDRRHGRKEHACRLRQAMIESGVQEICLECGQPPVWHDKPLCLQIDHRNGNTVDNRPDNVRFLCPNCHTQTSNYGSGNIKFPTQPPRRTVLIICEQCGKETHKLLKLVSKATHQFCNVDCRSNYHRSRKGYKDKSEVDSKHSQIYADFLRTKKYLTTAKNFGISDTMVRKIARKFSSSISHPGEILADTQL
jgi:hypothetical protein